MDISNKQMRENPSLVEVVRTHIRGLNVVAESQLGRPSSKQAEYDTMMLDSSLQDVDPDGYMYVLKGDECGNLNRQFYARPFGGIVAIHFAGPGNGLIYTNHAAGQRYRGMTLDAAPVPEEEQRMIADRGVWHIPEGD